MRINTRFLIATLALMLCAMPGIAQGGIDLDVRPAPDVRLEPRAYDGGFFSMELPSGWVIQTVGEYENFGFRAYDPNAPARQLFFYGNMRYFLKSEQAKVAWRTYIQYGGYSDAQVYADAPVLSPPTAEQFFYTFGDYTAYAAKYGIYHDFPAFDELYIAESTPRNSPISAYCVDDSVVRALFSYNGVPCEGLFAAGVADAMTTNLYNTDGGYYVVYFITGISAPADEFYTLRYALARSLSSFQFSESYIRQGVERIQWGTQLALEVGRTLSQAADSYNRAWEARQRTNDALSQKWSDATLGYARLYDTQTGAVYRAEPGFYERYSAERESYNNPNLQPVPDDSYELYEKPISGYIYD